MIEVLTHPLIVGTFISSTILLGAWYHAMQQDDEPEEEDR